MEKHIYVIEDSMKDMDSFFVFLHEMLLGTRRKNTAEILTSDQVKVYFLHICWDAETLDGKRAEFDAINSVVQRHVEALAAAQAFEIQYVPILLKNASYSSDSTESYSKNIISELRQIEGIGSQDSQIIPANGNRAVLMDVILNDDPDKDMRWLAEKISIPTNYLYGMLNAICIPYSKYPTANILNEWCNLSHTDQEEPVFRRFHLTRSRGVYLPLERKLHQILQVERNED